MNRASLLLLVSSACVTYAPAVRPAPAAPCADVPFPEDVTADYYDISGGSSTQLRREMDAKGPVTDGKRNDAYTHWHVDWRYPFQKSAAGCTTGPATITLKTSYQFPRWTGEPSGDAELRRRWHCYQGALLTHEDGHRVHGRDAAAEIEAKLPTLPPRRTCDEMDAAANAEGQRILQHYRDLDREYDAKTNHGATQGATFR